MVCNPPQGSQGLGSQLPKHWERKLYPVEIRKESHHILISSVA